MPYAASENPRQRLDLLLPKKPNTDKPLPLIAFIHGGGWRGGDKRRGLSRVVEFVESGDYAGVSIGYRLTDEAIWPAQIHDCKAAIRWIRANAKKYRLDPDRIGVMGTSAGGHLVAMLGTSDGVKELEGDLGNHKGISSRVACVVDLFGPTELLAMSQFPGRMDPDAPNSAESRLVGGPLQQNKEIARSASATSYVSADDAPFLFIHGTKDPVVPLNQSERLHTALRRAKVEALFIKMDGGGHGGFHSSSLQKRIRLFYDKHLRGQDVTISEES
ncbi:MAG: alpha/beta hydrolase fold domain-containing protein, partial [Woeseiaceae bacterium]